jgi:ATP-dependent RNA helicase RhlB
MLAISVFRKIGDLLKKLTGTGGRPTTTPVIPPQHPPALHREQDRQAKRVVKSQRERDRRETPRPHPDRQIRPPRVTRTRPESIAETHRPVAQWDPAEFNVNPEPRKVRFHDLDLPVEVMHAIHDLGFQYCTPIQAGILAHTLSGKDATGRAQTGTGKTAAFLVTILTHFSRKPAPKPRKKGAPRALILAPTRELVLQIEKDAKSLARYTSHKAMAVFGGMEYGKQQGLLKSSADIVAATPGRLLDFKRNGYIDLSQVEILVIDEADRMLDMGFIPDVRRIIESTPMKGTRQTLFFSATLTPEVNRLAAAWTRQPVLIDVTPSQEITLSTTEQMVYITTDEEKFTLLYNMIAKRNLERVMLFANRRDETQFLKDRLDSRGIHCGLLSGDVSQAQRGKTLDAFRNGKFKVLVATDVAARGLHIEGVSHVVNYSLPMDPQDYVHRIGRTGRAGASGISVSFATETEAYQLPEIEEYIGRKLVAVHPEPDLLTPLPALAEGIVEPKKRTSRSPQGGNRRSGPRSGSGHGRRRPGGGRKP